MAGSEARRNTVIGRSHRKVDAVAKVTGSTKFADDIVLPRMGFAKLLRSPHAHARIVGIDVTAAAFAQGVYAVIMGSDLPIRFGILPVSEDEHALAPDKVRFVGDPIAAVAAVSEDVAVAALEQIQVEYEPLQAIGGIEDALSHPEPRIHDYGPLGNLHKTVDLEFGEVEDGFAEADLIQEDLFFFEGNTHLPMEQHAAVAQWSADGQLILWSSTQTPHYVHRALAKVLELPPARIRVIACPNGGGFGGKSDPFSHEIAVAKLAMITGRPIKITLTREEVFYCHRGRHPTLMSVKTGVTKDGSIRAMHFKSVLDGGGYRSYGVASTYYTGALQTVVPPNAVTANYLQVGSIGLRECIEKVVDASGWKSRFRQLPYGRGLGLAGASYICGAGLPIYWNDMPHSGVQLKCDRGGGVTVFCGSTEIGQGSDSILAYIVAELLGIDPLEISVFTGDTDLTPVDLGSYSSRVTLMTGNAAIQAATRTRSILADHVARHLEVPAARIAFAERRVFDSENPERGVTFAKAIQLAEAAQGTVGALESYTPPRSPGRYRGTGVGPSPAYSYSAAVAEVEVDPESGIVTVPKIWIAHDIGRSINPVAGVRRRRCAHRRGAHHSRKNPARAAAQSGRPGGQIRAGSVPGGDVA